MTFNLSDFFSFFGSNCNIIETAVLCLVAFVLIYDFMHSLFSAVSSFFRKGGK